MIEQEPEDPDEEHVIHRIELSAAEFEQIKHMLDEPVDEKLAILISAAYATGMELGRDDVLQKVAKMNATLVDEIRNDAALLVKKPEGSA